MSGQRAPFYLNIFMAKKAMYWTGALAATKTGANQAGVDSEQLGERRSALGEVTLGSQPAVNWCLADQVGVSSPLRGVTKRTLGLTGGVNVTPPRTAARAGAYHTHTHTHTHTHKYTQIHTHKHTHAHTQGLIPK